jgi:hypothetical protein
MLDWQTDHKLQQYNIMAILSKGTTFSSGQSVTAANLNALVDSANFVAGGSGTTDNTTLQVHGSGYLEVKDGGITNAKLAAGAVNASSIADGTITVTQLANDAVITEKIADNAITSAKISDTDTQFLVDDTSAQKKVVINEAGADVDFRVEGDTDANLLVCDATNDRVVIGAAAPTESSKFSVVGSGSAVVASIENSDTGTGLSALVIKGPNPITQYQDTSTSARTFNVGVAGSEMYIDIINADGSATRVFSLENNGQLHLKTGMTIAYDL